MKTLHVIQNVGFEGPGALAAWAARAGWELRVVRPFLGEPFPRAHEVESLVVLGGPYSAGELATLPWLVEERLFLEEILLRRTPALGICLGAQLMAEILGGAIRRAPHAEIGWHPVSLDFLPAPAILSPLGACTTELFQWHGDEFVPPPGAVSLGRSAACACQAFSFGDHALAFAAHPEITPSLVEAYIRACWKQELASSSPFAQNPDRMREGATRFQAGSENFLFRLLDRWCERRASPSCASAPSSRSS